MGRSKTPDHGQIRAAMKKLQNLLRHVSLPKRALPPCGRFSVFPFRSCSTSRLVVLKVSALTKASL